MPERLCPRCEKDLLRRKVRALDLFGCRLCGGVWAEGVEMKKLRKTGGGEALGEAQAVEREATRPAQDVNTVSPVSCPTCRRRMTRIGIASVDVDIDFCEGHGTWFDRGELAKVAKGLPKSYKAAALAAGGALAGVAAAGAIVATQAAQPQGSALASVAGDVAGGVAEVLVEGAFELVGELISGVFS